MYMSARTATSRRARDLFTRHPSAVEQFPAPIFRYLPGGTKIVFSNAVPSAISPEYVRPVDPGEEYIGADDVEGYHSDLERTGVPRSFDVLDHDS
jgi:hypothetical protein